MTVAIILVAPGCEQAAKPMGVMVDSVNYMHERAVRYTLYDLSQTPPIAVGGSYVARLAQGGAKGCCVTLPNQWHPHMMVRLEWEEGDTERIFEKQSRELEIPRYDSPADLFVVFYANNEVELVVSAAEPGHPEWRGRNKKTPWDECVETFGRKPCFLALPKMFDTQSSQGFCTYLKEIHDPRLDEICEDEMFLCMKDFEDEQFCNGILWGQRRK